MDYEVLILSFSLIITDLIARSYPRGFGVLGFWGFGDIFGIFWGYFRDILRIFWGYFGDILRIFLGYFWDILGIF